MKYAEAKNKVKSKIYKTTTIATTTSTNKSIHTYEQVIFSPIFNRENISLFYI